MSDPNQPHPSVADHPAEVLFAQAAQCGELAVGLIQAGLDAAIEEVVSAASYYHEAQREAGECPRCGAIVTDPWGGIHYNTSVGCCIEPSDVTFDEALGAKCDADMRMADAMRLKR